MTYTKAPTSIDNQQWIGIDIFLIAMQKADQSLVIIDRIKLTKKALRELEKDSDYLRNVIYNWLHYKQFNAIDSRIPLRVSLINVQVTDRNMLLMASEVDSMQPYIQEGRRKLLELERWISEID
jgi:hypothetical protein